jgi:hypothetical protein
MVVPFWLLMPGFENQKIAYKVSCQSILVIADSKYFQNQTV